MNQSEGTMQWQVVSYQKNGREVLSKPMGWAEACNLWAKKNSRSPRRFAVRKAQ